jgi:hypothetical protein
MGKSDLRTPPKTEKNTNAMKITPLQLRDYTCELRIEKLLDNFLIQRCEFILIASQLLKFTLHLFDQRIATPPGRKKRHGISELNNYLIIS